jgi:hypothetical protein
MVQTGPTSYRHQIADLPLRPREMCSYVSRVPNNLLTPT